MFGLFGRLLKWMFILGGIIMLISIIYLGIYSVVDPEGYQTFIAEAEQHKKEEEERLEAERIEAEEKRRIEEERRASMWCDNEDCNRYAQCFNDRHPDHPIDKNNVRESYGTIDIVFNGYKIFYKNYNVDDGIHAGENAIWIDVQGEFSGSGRKLNEEDKKSIQAAYSLNDTSFDELAKAFNNGEKTVRTSGKEFHFSGNGNGRGTAWTISYVSVY